MVERLHVYDLFAEGWPDERYSMGLYVSEEVALAGLKSIYGSPYKVKWTERRTDECLEIVGDFEHVTGYSTEHKATFTITRVEVLDAALHTPDSAEEPESE